MKDYKKYARKLAIICILIWPLSYVNANDISKIDAKLLHQQLESLGENQLPPIEDSQKIFQHVDNFITQVYQIVYSANDHLDAHIYTNDSLSKRNLMTEMRQYMNGRLNVDNYYKSLAFLVNKKETENKANQLSKKLNVSYRVYLHLAVIDFLKYLESENINDLKQSLKAIQKIKTFKSIKDVHYWDFVIRSESSLVTPKLTDKEFVFYVKDFWHEFVLKHETLSSGTVIKNGNHDLKHYYLSIIDFVLSRTLSLERNIDLNSLSGIFLQMQQRLSPEDEKNIDNIKFFRISDMQTGNDSDQFLLTNAVASHYRKASVEQIFLHLDKNNIEAADKEYQRFRFLSNLVFEHSKTQKSVIKMVIDALELKIKLHQRYAQIQNSDELLKALLDDAEGQFISKTAELYKNINSNMKGQTPGNITGYQLFNIQPKPKTVEALLQDLGYLGDEKYSQYLSDMHLYLERLTAYQLLLDQYYDAQLAVANVSQNEYSKLYAQKLSNLDISSNLLDYINRTNSNLITLTSFNDFFLLNRHYSNMLLSDTSNESGMVNSKGLFRLLQGIEINPFALTTDTSGNKSTVFLKYIDIVNKFTDQSSYRKCLYQLADNIELSKDSLKLQDYDYWQEGTNAQKVTTAASEQASIDENFSVLIDQLVEFLRADLIDKEAFQKYHDFVNANRKIFNIAKVPANMLNFYVERDRQDLLLFKDSQSLNINAFNGCDFKY